MTKSSLLLLLSLILLASCQKQYEPTSVTGSGSSSGGGSSSGSSNGKLSKTYFITGPDTTTILYTYNSSGQLTKATTTTLIPGVSIVSSYTFTRDNNNRVLSFLFNYNIPGYPINGVVYNCHYPAGSSLFDYAVARYDYSGSSFVDSFVFVAVAGQITNLKTYQNPSNAGYELYGNTEYTYDVNGNITGNKYYSLFDGTGKLSLERSVVYQFDNKVNALQLGQEGLLLGDQYQGKNNSTQWVFTDNTTVPPGKITTTNFTFGYNAGNQPTTSTGIDTPGGAKIVTTYTY